MKEFYRGRIVSYRNGITLFETTAPCLEDCVRGCHWLVNHFTSGASLECVVSFNEKIVFRGNFYSPALPRDFQFTYIGGGQLD